MKLFIMTIAVLFFISMELISCERGEHVKDDSGDDIDVTLVAGEECTDEDSTVFGECMSKCGEVDDSMRDICDGFVYDRDKYIECHYAWGYYGNTCYEYCQYLPCGSPRQNGEDEDEGYRCWLPDNPMWECTIECRADFYPHEVECEDLYDYGSSEWSECLDPYLEDYCSCWSPCLDLPCSSGKLPCVCLPGGCP